MTREEWTRKANEALRSAEKMQLRVKPREWEECVDRKWRETLLAAQNFLLLSAEYRARAELAEYPAAKPGYSVGLVRESLSGREYRLFCDTCGWARKHEEDCPTGKREERLAREEADEKKWARKFTEEEKREAAQAIKKQSREPAWDEAKEEKSPICEHEWGRAKPRGIECRICGEWRDYHQKNWKEGPVCGNCGKARLEEDSGWFCSHCHVVVSEAGLCEKTNFNRRCDRVKGHRGECQFTIVVCDKAKMTEGKISQCSKVMGHRGKCAFTIQKQGPPTCENCGSEDCECDFGHNGDP